VRLFWYHGLQVELGIGADPEVAADIFNSVTYKPGTANTAVGDACRLSLHPGTRPAPVRLAHRLVLDRGGVVLTSPGPSQPAMSARRAWAASGPKSSLETYEIILARYSAELPARLGPHGKLEPLDENVFAWVVYASPETPGISGCGGWGVDVFNARTGGAIISSGWSPGP
jgi:hypothetical protein